MKLIDGRSQDLEPWVARLDPDRLNGADRLLLNRLCARAVRQGGLSPGTYEGKPAADIVQCVYAALTRELTRECASYSPLMHRWFGRRVAHALFEAKLLNLMAPGFRQISIATGFHPSPIEHATGDRNDFAYPYTEIDFFRYIHLIATAHAAARCRDMVQEVFLGSRVKVNDDLTIDMIDTEASDEALRRAMASSLFSGIPFPSLGSYRDVFTEILSQSDSDDLRVLLLPKVPRPHSINWNLPFDSKRYGDEVEFTPALIMHSIPLSELVDLTAATCYRWWLEPALKIVLMCVVGRFVISSDSAFASVLRYGYLSIQWQEVDTLIKDMYRNFARHVAKSTGFDELPDDFMTAVEQAERFESSFDRFLAGRCVFRTTDRVVIDALTCMEDLAILLAAPRIDGSLANQRAKDFERVIQEIIDKSRAAPNSVLRQLVGRTLQIDGHAVTDIDAIAEEEDRIILISCKSILIDEPLGAMDYSKYRAERDRIRSAIEKWTETIRTLRVHRVGENYTLEKDKRIVGAVCIPFLPILPIEIEDLCDHDHVLGVFSARELAQFVTKDYSKDETKPQEDSKHAR